VTAISPPVVAVYPTFVDAALSGLVDLTSTDLFAVLLTDGYTYDPTDEFLSAISGGDRIAVSDALTGVSVTDGTVVADPTVLPTVAGGSTIVAWAAYLDGVSDAARRLVCYVTRNADSTLLDIDTNGLDVTLTFYPDGRVFKI
jgi:hypothetical protein